MSKRKKTPDGKHLSAEDRDFIASSLAQNMTFKAIAAYLTKDPTTISREVKTNRIFQQAGSYVEKGPNLCLLRKNCTESYLCPPEDRRRHCYDGCHRCRHCNDVCKRFIKQECETLKKAPFVCNGCAKRRSCRLEKYYYRATTAQRMYEQRLRTSRLGIHIGEQECMELDNFITPLIKKGQPISHVYHACPDRIPCSKSTLYRYVSSGVLSLKNIDLRGVVRYRKRKKKHVPRLTNARKGRTYLDFLLFIETNPDAHIWEMDVVEGKKGGKVLLTLFSRQTKLMLIFLLDQNTQEEVLATLNFFEEQIGSGLFCKTFHVILTDNGSSFLQAYDMEMSFLSDMRRTFLFYCDPYASYQKGGVEKNHEYIRWVLPKGSAFDHLSCEDVALLASHINSVARDSLDGLSPIQAMKAQNPSLLERVYLWEVRHSEVTLTPGLLR